MSELNFKSAKKPLGITVVWEEGAADDSHVYLGDTVQGELTGIDQDVGPNNSNVYKIKLDDGKIVSVWGTTVLDDFMLEGNEGEAIPVGAIVRIECLGKKQGLTGPSKQAGKGYWTFDVQFAIPSPAFKAAAGKTAVKTAADEEIVSKGQKAAKPATEDEEEYS